MNKRRCRFNFLVTSLKGIQLTPFLCCVSSTLCTYLRFKSRVAGSGTVSRTSCLPSPPCLTRAKLASLPTVGPLFQDGRSHRPQRECSHVTLEEKPELQLSFHFRKVPDPCGLRYVCDEESGQSSVKFSHQLVSVMSTEKQVSGWVFWRTVKREGLSPSPLGDAGGIAGSPKWSVMGMCEIEVPLVRTCSCGYRSPEIDDLVPRAHFWVSAANFLWR